MWPELREQVTQAKPIMRIGLRGGPEGNWLRALTGAGIAKWLRAFGAGPALSGLACRKPWLSRLLSSLIPDRVWQVEPEAMLVG